MLSWVAPGKHMLGSVRATWTMAIARSPSHPSMGQSRWHLLLPFWVASGIDSPAAQKTYLPSSSKRDQEGIGPSTKKERGWRVLGGKLRMRMARIVENEKWTSWLIGGWHFPGKRKDNTAWKSRKCSRKKENYESKRGAIKGGEETDAKRRELGEWVGREERTGSWRVG